MQKCGSARPGGMYGAIRLPEWQVHQLYSLLRMRPYFTPRLCLKNSLCRSHAHQMCQTPGIFGENNSLHATWRFNADLLAERVGFEPPIGLMVVQRVPSCLNRSPNSGPLVSDI